MARKYQKYAIRVEYLNGDQENINLMGIRTDNYNKMLSVYHGVKERYSDKVKVIDFCGVCEDGTIGIMFRKEIKHKGKDELKENASEIASRISKDLETIKNKNFYHYNMISVLNKKQDLIIHMIESFQGSDSDKLKLFNELEELRKVRRWHKNELKNIQQLQSNKIGKSELNFTHLSNVFSSVEEDNKDYSNLNYKKAENVHMFKQEILKNKELQESKLKKQYEKVYTDEAENIVYAYNKSKVM